MLIDSYELKSRIIEKSKLLQNENDVQISLTTLFSIIDDYTDEVAESNYFNCNTCEYHNSNNICMYCGKMKSISDTCSKYKPIKNV